jgi:RimJ/RimL family protein N-acetyltransferase
MINLIKIVKLTEADYELYRNIRLEALVSDPESFSTSYFHESAQEDVYWQNKLINNDVFAVFDLDKIVGCCGFYIMPGDRFEHRGVIWGVYISSPYRGKNLAGFLLDEVISFASSKVAQIHLSCMIENIAAVKLYKKKGFRVYGVEPKTVRIGQKYFDDFLMVKEFK